MEVVASIELLEKPLFTQNHVHRSSRTAMERAAIRLGPRPDAIPLTCPHFVTMINIRLSDSCYVEHLGALHGVDTLAEGPKKHDGL